jgi:hypothetical protein
VNKAVSVLSREQDWLGPVSRGIDMAVLFKASFAHPKGPRFETLQNTKFIFLNLVSKHYFITAA